MVDLCPLIQTFINAHLAVYLIWQKVSSAKGAKKNTSPNVIFLQYLIHANVVSSFMVVNLYWKVVYI